MPASVKATGPDSPAERGTDSMTAATSESQRPHPPLAGKVTYRQPVRDRSRDAGGAGKKVCAVVHVRVVDVVVRACRGHRHGHQRRRCGRVEEPCP